MADFHNGESGLLAFRYSTCAASHLHMHVEKVPDPLMETVGESQTIDIVLTPEQVVEHLGALVQFLAFVGHGVIELDPDFPLDQMPGFEDGEEDNNG